MIHKNKINLIILFCFIFNCSGQRKKQEWEQLILNTGYVEDISSLSENQLQYLEKIKKKSDSLEEKSILKAKEVFDSFYQDNNAIEELYLNGLNLPKYGSDIWEFYYESYDENKYLIAIIVFKKFDIIDTSYIN